MFAEEKPTLLPLPLEPFRYSQYSERIVHLDGCVEVEAANFKRSISNLSRCSAKICKMPNGSSKTYPRCIYLAATVQFVPSQ
jgi:hypothetical protein